MKKAIILLFILLFSVSKTIVFAHGGEDHKKEQKDTLNITIEDATHDNATKQHLMEEESNIIEASMDDFPSLHPLIVHFPIVLLLLAFLAQLMAFLIWKKELNWFIFMLLLGGFLGAYTASTYIHPHTSGLTDAAIKVLEQHDLFADYTLWLSGIGLLFKAIALFFFKDKLWLEIVIALLLAGAAYSVSQAGHYGATLTHIHGVGVQGNFIESASDGHSHSH